MELYESSRRLECISLNKGTSPFFGLTSELSYLMKKKKTISSQEESCGSPKEIMSVKRIFILVHLQGNFKFKL